ncbi:helix-turn-helix transcriptional regulator [bacterium]|nr:helix-turn-helix transcriptional regulator [bacterium]
MVDARYPGAACMGLAFWLAWLHVACPALWGNAVIWSALSLGAVHSWCVHVVINAAVALVIVGMALFDRRLGRPASDTAFLVAGGIAAFAGTIGLLVSVVASLPAAWFALFCLVAGAGMGMLLTRCMLLYGALTSQRVLLLASASWCLAFVIDALFRIMPPQMAIPVFCALPVVAAVLFGLHHPTPAEGAAYDAVRGAGHVELPRSFWQFAFTVFLVALVSETVVYLNSYQTPTRMTLMTHASLVTIMISLAVMIYAAIAPRPRMYAGLYYPTIFVVMSLLGLLFVTPTGTRWSLVASLAACQLYKLLVWCLLGCVVMQSHAPSLRVFGFGLGTQTLGSVIGYALGALLGNALDSSQANLLPLYVATAMIVLALSLAVYPPKAMHDLLAAISDEDAVGHVASTVSDAWTLVCDRLAAEGELTAREREVMMLLARGRGSVYIAERLGVTLSTVYTHTRNLYRKLDVHSREELMGLVDKRLAGEAPTR